MVSAFLIPLGIVAANARSILNPVSANSVFIVPEPSISDQPDTAEILTIPAVTQGYFVQRGVDRGIILV